MCLREAKSFVFPSFHRVITAQRSQLHQPRNPVYNTLNSFFFVWCFKHKACFYICALHERSDLTENIQNQSHNEKGKPQEINQSQLSETYSIVTYEYNAGELLFSS